MVQDFGITVIAAITIWTLNASTVTQKVAHNGVLALAFIVCFVGVVRLGYFAKIYAANSDWSCELAAPFPWSKSD